MTAGLNKSKLHSRTCHRHPAKLRRGSGAGGRHQKALARLHSGGVAKSRRTPSLPRAGGRRLPLWGGAPSQSAHLRSIHSKPLCKNKIPRYTFMLDSVLGTRLFSASLWQDKNFLKTNEWSRLQRSFLRACSKRLSSWPRPGSGNHRTRSGFSSPKVWKA